VATLHANSRNVPNRRENKSFEISLITLIISFKIVTNTQGDTTTFDFVFVYAEKCFVFLTCLKIYDWVLACATMMGRQKSSIHTLYFVLFLDGHTGAALGLVWPCQHVKCTANTQTMFCTGEPTVSVGLGSLFEILGQPVTGEGVLLLLSAVVKSNGQYLPCDSSRVRLCTKADFPQLFTFTQHRLNSSPDLPKNGTRT
jgi:hypothetical protein